jgi:putative oxidoreductase
MSSLDSLRRCRALGLRWLAALAFLPPLLTRLVMGQAFHETGSGKIEHLDNVVRFFTELGIPWPEANALFVSRLEYWGGLLLVAGLLTRVVAGLLSSSMLVALLTADRAAFLDALRGSGDAGLTDVTSFVYLMFLLWLVVAGPGVVSLDALVARFLERTREKAAPPSSPPA